MNIKDVIFLLLIVAVGGTSYYYQYSWLIPAALLTVFVTLRTRRINLARLKQKKIAQTIANAASLGVSAEQVEQWFQSPQWQQKENYIDVHPGRIADEIARFHDKNAASSQDQTSSSQKPATNQTQL